MRGAEGLDVGDRVRVELLDTNVERGSIDFGSLGRGSGEGLSALEWMPADLNEPAGP